jgi:hypothetical protein
MHKQLTRRRATRGAARTLAMGVAAAVLVGIVGAGQALAAVAVPDERVLERQGMIDRQPRLGQVDEQGRVALPPQLSSEDRAAARAEQERSGPQLGGQQVAPNPVPAAPAGAPGALVVMLVVAALLLAVGATATWRVRHRRPQPESTA